MDTILCQYRYDALDRLVTCAPTALAAVQRFYQKTRLATEIQGQMQRTIFQHDDGLLAQQQSGEGLLTTTLLLTDQQRSVLRTVNPQDDQLMAYTAYGHRRAENGLTSLLGFNGERSDPMTGHYLLGNGYRAFNPVLMRFNSPDSLSPFGRGGLNGYAYCVGDPVNYSDPTGGTPMFFKSLLRRVGLMKKPDLTPVAIRYIASSALNNGEQQASRPTNIASNESLANSPAGPPVIAGNNQTPPSFERFAKASNYLLRKAEALENLIVVKSLKQQTLGVIVKDPSLMNAYGIPPSTEIQIRDAIENAVSSAVSGEVNNDRIRDYYNNQASYSSHDTVKLARKVKTTNRHIRMQKDN
jgi:RHS repeat-associated protein